MSTLHPQVHATHDLSALREVLRCGSPGDQVMAAEKLGLLGDSIATGVLESALTDADRPTAVRCAAATALGRIGWGRSCDPLVRVLAHSLDPQLRCAAAAALGSIGHPSALPALTAGLASAAAEVRRTCAGALSRLGAEGREWLGVLGAGGGVAAADARDALAVCRA